MRNLGDNVKLCLSVKDKELSVFDQLFVNISSHPVDPDLLYKILLRKVASDSSITDHPNTILYSTTQEPNYRSNDLVYGGRLPPPLDSVPSSYQDQTLSQLMIDKPSAEQPAHSICFTPTRPIPPGFEHSTDLDRPTSNGEMSSSSSHFHPLGQLGRSSCDDLFALDDSQTISSSVQ